MSLVDLAFRRSRHNLGDRIASGALWQYGLVAARAILTIGSTAIMARLLLPQDYGLNGMSSVVVELASLLTNLGFSSILVQQRRLTRISLDTVFWASIAIGCFLVLSVMLLAVPASWFFGQPELVAILCVSSLTIVMREALVVPYALLHRLLLFRIDALLQLSILVVRIGTAITLAWLGFGYWALILASVISIAVEVIAACVITGYRPRMKFSRYYLTTTWKQSGSYLGSGILYYLLANFDNIVVGRRFGAQELGYYSTAYTLPDELRNRLAYPLIRVLFPAYARIQDDLPTFRALVMRSQRLMAVLVLPLGVGLAMCADPLVRILYGENWLPVIPIVEVLAIGGATRALFSLIGSIFAASGRPDIALKIAIGSVPFTLPLVYVGSYWGSIGVAWAMIGAQIPALFGTYFAAKLIQSSPWDFLRATLPAATASAVMAIVLKMMSSTIAFSSLLVGFQLGLLVLVGGLVYVVAILTVSAQTRADCSALLAWFQGKRGSAS